MARGPSRCAASFADVTVPVVSRNDSDGRSCASAAISGRMALVSPTLAAWNQASRPAGRLMRGWPRRSLRRSGSSLPRRSRRPQQQRRDRARIAGDGPIALEPQAGLRAPSPRARNGVAQVAARTVVGLLGGQVQVVFDLLPVLFELLRSCLSRHPHDRPDGKAQARVGQVDLHPAPGVEREIPLGGNRHRQDRSARLLGRHDDAETSLTRLSSRHVRGHRDSTTVAQRLDGGPVGVGAATVLVAAGGACTTDQLHVEALERLTQERGIGVPRQHDVGRVIGRLDERQQHEFAVPHADDARMEWDVRLYDLVHLRDAPRGAAHIADVAGERGTRQPVDQSCSLRNVRHAWQSWPVYETARGLGSALL